MVIFFDDLLVGSVLNDSTPLAAAKPLIRKARLFLQDHLTWTWLILKFLC